VRIGQIAIDIAPLRESRDFRRLFAGRFVSMAGNAVATTAADWQVYSLTHNSLAVGLLTLASSGGMFIGLLTGGMLADRHDRRTLLMPVRLPQASDLLPPALALRLLSFASSSTRISRLPSQRVAGVAAAGLQLVPADPRTTVGAVDIWADPADGLPVEVTVTERGARGPALVTRFLDLSLSRPSLATVTPDPAPGVGVTTTALPDITRILNRFAPPLPARIAGMARAAGPAGLSDVAAYGTGFSRIAVLPLPGGVGQRALSAADDAGAGGISLTNGTGALIQTPLLTVLLAQAESGGPVYLLAGAVTPALLVRAGSDLLDQTGQEAP